MRHKLGLSQTKLAKALGVSQPVVSRIETGRRKPSIDEIAVLASALEVPLSALLGDEPTTSTRVRLSSRTDRYSRLGLSSAIARLVDDNLRDVLTAGVALRSVAKARDGRQPLAAAEVATLLRAGLVSLDAGLEADDRGTIRDGRPRSPVATGPR